MNNRSGNVSGILIDIGSNPIPAAKFYKHERVQPTNQLHRFNHSPTRMHVRRINYQLFLLTIKPKTWKH